MVEDVTKAEKPKTEKIRTLKRVASLLVSAVGLTAILLNLEFNLLEASLYDLRASQGSAEKTDSHIVVITLDDKTTKGLNDYAPLALDVHVRFLEVLEQMSPRGIGYLVNMNYVNQVNPEFFVEEWGERFNAIADRMKRNHIPFIIGTPFDVNGEVLPPYPLSSIDHSIAVIHQDGNVFSEDKVTRRALTYLYGRPTFHLALATASGFVPENFRPRGSFRVDEIDGEYFFFKYKGDTKISNFNDGNPSQYRRISFLDVLEGRVDPELLRDKIILVGTLGRENPSDFTKTPYSKVPFSNPKVLIHANILDSIIHNDGTIVAPEWVNWMNTLIVISIVLWAVLSLTPMYSVFTTLGLTFVFLVIGQLFFKGWGFTNGIWFHESQPLVGIFLAFYLAVPYRLIREYKKRWDYQRKNEILVQVEELKTNFLNLVTHDLKTPVARIQGLTEVVMKGSGNKLSENDKKSLGNILASTDELNRFITSILELSKVQTKRIKLQLESKDVNSIIEDSVRDLRTHAASREIEIETHLEPMFPIKLDPALVSKVINNLIDNAIKYSPEGSKIEVSSKESGDAIEISVKDYGIGLSESELESVFTKFYRAKNDSTIQIKGTGLGLYLTKFFVEAHLGQVSVVSEKDKGSTFTISLPIDLSSEKLAAHARQKAQSRPGLTLDFKKRFEKLTKSNKTV